ncbi:MAG: gliding motility protein, partial [Deltaproteobacteria bacterium]
MFLLLLPACGLLAEHYGAPADPTDGTELEIEVPAGATIRSMAAPLAEAGAIADADAFVTWARITGEGACIKAGRHRVRPDMDAWQLTAALCDAPLPDDVPFTVVEGWRIREIDAALVEAGLAEAGAYTAAANAPDRYTASFPLPDDTLEGYLYPDTYMVDPTRFSVEDFIQRQLDELARRFVEPHADDLEPRGLHAIVTMASMIER